MMIDMYLISNVYPEAFDNLIMLRYENEYNLYNTIYKRRENHEI